MSVRTSKSDIGRSAFNRQTAQNDFIEKLWKNGLSKDDLADAGVEGQAKAGLDEIKESGCGPRLRYTGDRIKCGSSCLLTRKATKEFGQTPKFDIV
jgi:hypothetical protein